MIVHETPGLIDLKAFTTFGINSKPNAINPIGYFGTGLKYAIAVLAREGCPVTVWIGEEPHVFYCEKTQFRDKEFLQLRLKRQRGVTARWMSTELPFTTELGKNWKIWQALRELHSNTLDENGKSYFARAIEGFPDTTRIVVEGDAYVDAFAKLDEIFLPGHSAQSAVYGVECRDQPSKHAYYRGLRVLDLPRPALFTWNVLHSLSLTEDRTLQHPFMVEHYVGRHVLGSSDPAFIKQVLQAKEETFEHSIGWESLKDYPATPEFVEMARLYGRRETVHFVERHDRTHAPTKTEQADWRADLVKLLEPNSDGDALLKAVRTHAQKLINLLKEDIERTKE